MLYVEAPNLMPERLRTKHSLFLAGGITGAPNWQAEMCDLLAETDLALLNPLRASFDIADASMAREQIRWEHVHLALASAVSFWFPCETLCPITLFELGAWSYWRSDLGQPKPLFVGVHPDYARRLDVEVQLHLARPEIEIMYSLGDLAGQVRDWRLQVLAGADSTLLS